MLAAVYGRVSAMRQRSALDELRMDTKKQIWEAVVIYDPDRLSRKYSYVFFDETGSLNDKINIIKEIIEVVFETPGIYFSCIVINTKRFKVFEYNHTLKGTKKGPSS